MERQGDSNDSERIAQVTYLFGIKPDEIAEEPAAPPTAPASRVRFVETAQVEPVSAEVEPVSSERKSARPDSARPDSARPQNVSMHALTRKGMSVAEMTKLLENREIDADDVSAEIERLEGVGLLDDSALAENLVRTLQDRKGLGRSAISAELRRRKVDQVAIEEALESIDTDDELERAIEVATKRAGQLSSYDAATAKRRLGAYMQRRGYGGSILSQAMAAALEPHSSGAASRNSGGPRFR